MRRKRATVVRTRSHNVAGQVRSVAPAKPEGFATDCSQFFLNPDAVSPGVPGVESRLACGLRPQAPASGAAKEPGPHSGPYECSVQMPRVCSV
jgi:hypothetical protein